MNKKKTSPKNNSKSASYKQGDALTVTLKKPKKVLQGAFVPSPVTQKDILILKLESGYNIGLQKKNIATIVLSQKKQSIHSVANKPTVRTATKKNAPVISLLHTGGTIASKVDYKQGGVSADFSAEAFIALFPEVAEMAQIKTRNIMQLQSEMMRFAHFNHIAKEVAKEIKKGVDGVIVTHGTDTLHYSTAALAFCFENCSVPVIFVGAQRSADRGSSDAGENILNAVFFITQARNFSGVGMCMHESLHDEDALILSATKSRKMHTSRRDAFRPINTLPIARVNYSTKKCSFLVQQPKKQIKKNNTLKLFNEKIKVGMLKQHPNISSDAFLFFKGYDGLLIEGTGLGHVSNQCVDEYTQENEKIQKAITTLTKSGTIVAVASQCIYGRIHLAVYAPLRELAIAGVIGHLHDMTSETAFIKLAWLLSNYSKEDTKKLFTQNLRGEITTSSPHVFLE